MRSATKPAANAMLKRIDVLQLKPGMYIHDLNCDWMSHPFLRKRFRVTSEAQVAQVAAAGIHELYIDTAQGDDAPDAPTESEVRVATEQEMLRVATEPQRSKISTGEELGRARRIVGEASQIVRDIMQDARLGKQVRIEQVEPMVERITDSILRNSGALLSLSRVKNKDDYTFVHSVSVCALLVSFGRALGMGREDIHYLGIGGMLHDIGKTTIPDAILNKPGRLTEDEFLVMKSHAAQSRSILAATPAIEPTVLQIAGEHHERYDGSGYPDGLKGEEISPMGQMAAICDVYDAITSDRVYHKGMTPAEGLRKIFEWSKFHFNPELVHAFLRTIGIYPVGSLVMLHSGRLAVVVNQNEEDLLKPTVRVIYHSRGNHYLPPEDIDLSRPLGFGGGDRIVGHELPEKWQIDPMRFL
jgi:HD-GYP domain-containing protein (c-di-GMP phosphodiesterase class II)